MVKRCNRRTHGQTNGRTEWRFLRAAWSQLKINTYALHTPNFNVQNIFNWHCYCWTAVLLHHKTDCNPRKQNTGPVFITSDMVIYCLQMKRWCCHLWPLTRINFDIGHMLISWRRVNRYVQVLRVNEKYCLFIKLLMQHMFAFKQTQGVRIYIYI